MSAYKDKTPRERYIVTIYLCITLPFAIGALIGSGAAYAAVFSLKSDTPLSWLHLLGLTAIMVVALVVGFVIGGWAWAILSVLASYIKNQPAQAEQQNRPRLGNIRHI